MSDSSREGGEGRSKHLWTPKQKNKGREEHREEEAEEEANLSLTLPKSIGGRQVEATDLSSFGTMQSPVEHAKSPKERSKAQKEGVLR